MENKMRIRVFFVFVLSVLCLLISCGTTNNVYDEDIPLEKTASLVISGDFTVKTYNGISVKLKTSEFGATGFRIPAGSTTLVMDLYSKIGNTIYRGKDIELKYKFLAGTEYRIWFGFLDADGNYKGSNIGKTYLGLLLCIGKDYKNPIYTMMFS